jgi:hypothetical protein
MQTQIIFVLATFAYFALVAYLLILSTQSLTPKFLQCLGLSAGYMFLTKTLNAGGLSYLALSVLYGTVLVVFLFLYSFFIKNPQISLFSGTYETLINTETNISGSLPITKTISNYKNVASPTYTIHASVKLTDVNLNSGTLLERPNLIKAEMLAGGAIKITTTGKTTTSETTIISDLTQLSTTQYVPFTFVVQPNTIHVYRNNKLIKSAKTETRQPLTTDNTILVGTLAGGSLDVLRFSDTNIL